ncbi:alpha/beta-hydrolase [Tilletiopsis washingtonensis]|uniref:Carboxypeptidase n=1 Tax=Tilletiopsis washingtonensis TaxID=58919 RepID=A0A316ZDP4_9BASI|nr:alpha/beta-hydrolase [Tilletiopsis washingtonensis]PWN99032.1 alpha/beta-hydrolase [Tilletiopsis washingtonensis]
MKLARCAALLSLAASALALQLPLYADGAAAAAAAAFDAVDSASSGAAGPQRIELPRAQAASAGAASTEELIARHRADFTVLTHEEFPEMSVRIKRINAPAAPSAKGKDDSSDPDAFCDPSVTSWSGYIDSIDGKSLFFTFFESRSNPSKDPLLLWTNGGPGCSSAIGLFMELGPCRVKDDGGRGRRVEGPPINGTTYNAYSWNSRMNTLFIDQPIGVGYSYSRYGTHTYDADQGAADVYKFLRIFLGAFERFASNELILSGESYGGRYIPRYAAEIADRNFELTTKAAKEGKKPDASKLLNLKRIAVGNGLTDITVQTTSYYDFTCTQAGLNPLYLDISTCKEMKVWKKRCEKMMQKVCRESFDRSLCAAAVNTCTDQIGGPYAETGRNPYNVQDDCKAGLSPNLCYDLTADIAAYLNRKDVRELLGAAPEAGDFQTCNMDVAAGFDRAGDTLVDNSDYVAGLLERGITALFYVGTRDWICNWLGNKQWIDAMEFAGAKAFKQAKNYRWLVDGKEAGETQRGGGLTWATIFGAGHMVPYDQPKNSLEMMNRWLDGEAL